MWMQRPVAAVVATVAILAVPAPKVARHARPEASPIVFADGFESGNLSQWTTVKGVVAQQQEVYAGAWAARATSAGIPTYATKSLATPLTELYVDHRFKVISQGTVNTSLVRLRTSTGGVILSMMRNAANGKLVYYNEVTGIALSSTVVTTGVWHELEVHAVVNGLSGQIEVWLDGVKINPLSKTDNLGTNAIGRIILGDNASDRTFDIAFDAVVASTASDWVAPSVPPGLAGTAVNANRVDLSWNPSTDNVAVTGYTVYRDGAQLTVVTGGATSYSDTSVSPNTTYGYTVDAFDAATNYSAQSGSVSVTTPAAPDTEAPTVPADLSGVAVLTTKVNLSWTASTDNVSVTEYGVYRDGTQIATVEGDETAYTDLTVQAATTYSYTVDAADGVGNRSAQSTAVQVTTPAADDTTPPSIPTGLTAAAVSGTQVNLSWVPSTDNVGIGGYTIYRDGAAIGSTDGTGTTYTDTSVVNSVTYSYRVDAFDLAGNHSAQSSPVSVTTPGIVFTDGFETGNLALWSVKVGMVAQQQEVYAGAWAARATSTGGQAYAYKVIAPAQPDLYYDHRFKVISQGANNVSVTRFFTNSGAAILSVMRSSSGRLIYWNQVTGVLSTSATSITTGAWHELQIHASINGTSGLFEVWLDGVRINDVSRTDNLGTSNISRVNIGDPATGRTFDVAFDSVIVTLSPDVVPPTVPSGVSATAIGPTHVNVTWTPSTDNVAVATYSIFRDGALAGTMGANATAFADFAATPSTSPSYQVEAVDASGNRSGRSAGVQATTPAPTGGDPTILAVGDIACDPDNPDYNGGQGTAVDCRQKYTSDVAFNANPSAILVLGDDQYEDGGYAKFQTSYDTSWGRVRTITHPVPGNHEYRNSIAFGYYTYFGAAAGDPTKGYYSYDVGAWHIIALNSECLQIGGCGHGSPEETWLLADLAAHSNTCTLAYWHEARFSSGTNGSYPDYDAFWQDLYGAGVDLVLNGHDHDYERFAPQDSFANPDPLGIREFVVGTGGRNLTVLGQTQANSEVFRSDTFGVLQLTLHPSGYDWSFLPEAGGSFTDAGSGSCH
jgi:acid phosphatase type 7